MWLDIFKNWIKEGKAQSWLTSQLNILNSNGELLNEVIDGVMFNEYQEITDLLTETFA